MILCLVLITIKMAMPTSLAQRPPPHTYPLWLLFLHSSFCECFLVFFCLFAWLRGVKLVPDQLMDWIHASSIFFLSRPPWSSPWELAGVLVPLDWSQVKCELWTNLDYTLDQNGVHAAPRIPQPLTFSRQFPYQRFITNNQKDSKVEETHEESSANYVSHKTKLKPFPGLAEVQVYEVSKP